MDPSYFDCKPLEHDNLEDYFKKTRDLGMGAFGKVYSATSTSKAFKEIGSHLPEKVAVKHIYINPGQVNPIIFKYEIQILKKIDSPRNMKYYGCFGDNHGNLYLITELINGKDLFDMVDKHFDPTAKMSDFLSVPIQKYILRDIALGIKELHDAGIIHRDLKPENIMVANSYDIKIIDYGLACLMSTGVGCHNRAGTKGYMDSKIILGVYESMKMADWWAFGQIAVIVLTGEPLFMEGYVDSVSKVNIPDKYLTIDALNLRPIIQNYGSEYLRVLLSLTDPSIPQYDRPDEKEILAAFAPPF